jgi:hypothetical protein
MCSNRLSYSGFLCFASANIEAFFYSAKLFDKNFQKKCTFVVQMRRIITINMLIITLLCNVKIFAQQRLIFEHAEHSFGNIREEAGRVSHSFRFRNGATEPVVILSVSTTCGCTVAKFDRRPIMPDSVGVIEVSFDPRNRPGVFDKEISVMTSEGGGVQKLKICGFVEERPRSVEERFPHFVGSGVRLEDNFHAFAYVEQGKPATTTIKIINTSNRAVRLRIFESRESGVVQLRYPERLAAGGEGEIAITYGVPIGSERYGTVDVLLDFEINGRSSEAFISLTGIIVDNRDKIDPKSAPRVEVMKNIVKFGAVKRHGDERIDSFTIENKGTAPLKIRSVEVLHSTVKVSLSAGDQIAVGEKREVKLRLNPLRIEYGPLSERIRIVTNDPEHPMRTVRVTAIIEE